MIEALSKRLPFLGFARGIKCGSMGAKFEIVSEPVVIARNLVTLDAIDALSGRIERVRIPFQF